MPETLAGVHVVVDLGTRDYEGYRRDLIALAPSLTPYWTDFSRYETAVVIGELFAYVGDSLQYYIDRATNEAFLPTAQQRRSVIHHCALIDYTLSQPSAASVELTVTCDASGTISEGDSFATKAEGGQASVIFTVYQSTAVVSGDNSVNAAHFRLESDEIIGSSSGTAGESFTLAKTPLVYHPVSGELYLTVEVDEGSGWTGWTEVDNFVDSDSTDLHYIVSVDEDDVTTITFGDGVSGKIPTSGTSNIRATYGYGGGEDGNNVGTAKITELNSVPSFVTACTNAAQPSGGADKESIDEAKENAPRSFATGDRCVTLEDYEAKALEVGGITRATAYKGDSPYQINVCVAVAGANPVPTGSWDKWTSTGSGLLASVGDYLESRKTAPCQLNVHGPTTVQAWYKVEVVCKANRYQRDCELAVQAAIDAFLDVEVRELGDPAKLSKFYKAIEAVEAVKDVDVLLFSRYPYVTRLSGSGELDLGDFSFGGDPPGIGKDQRYTIEIVTETTYKVTGTIDGEHAGTGTIGANYVISDDYSWRLDAGSPAPEVGSRYELRIGGEVDNIEADELELIIAPTSSSLASLTVTGGMTS